MKTSPNNFNTTIFTKPASSNGVSMGKGNKASSFEEQKAKLEAEKATLEAKAKAIEEAEKAEKEQLKAEKSRKSIELRELAQQYDVWAKEEAAKPKEERDFSLSPEHFLGLAREARTNAAIIEKELGLEVAEEEVIKEDGYNYKNTILIQRIMFFVLPILSLAWFFWVRHLILVGNVMLPPDEAVTAYGLDSIQKIGFSFFVRMTDILLLYGILKVIAPMIPDYLIPTSKSPKDAIHEFYNDLTPWQRLLISAAFVSAVLLYLALSPSVKA
jgi:hypothetical protein